jgi:hypothetical protein
MAYLSRHYTTAVDNLPVRILSVFDDQPGLRLTFSQIRRLLELPESECGDALAYLIRRALLQCNANRQYCLARLEERTPWISS